MTRNNIILMSDSYKVSHWKQYPPHTSSVYSYYESRGGEFDTTTFFGLQYIIKEHLAGKRVTFADIDAAEKFCEDHFGSTELFNRAGWERIAYVHHGLLPIRIKAVPEGTRVPTGNVLMTVENTDPQSFWLTNFLETLLCQVWYPSTVATLSGAARAMILDSLEKTGDPAGIDFKLHDFGFRGVSSVESAGIGGGAHLLNFLGTDTMHGITWLKDNYGDDKTGPLGFSIPASEHSTITSWGRDREVDAYRNMIEQYGDSPIYACVSDSYDIYGAAKNLWGGVLRDEVMAAPGTLVVRPDSGYPPHVVTYLLEILGSKFGKTKNNKGYKVLDPKVRVIQGDGLDLKMIENILKTMEHEGWSTDNIAFGMGGGLLQNVNRDTAKFAFKCSSAVVDGEQRDVYKQPVTDQGKDSKRGRLSLVKRGDEFFTVAEEAASRYDSGDLLETVFENGYLTKVENVTDIRKRAQS